MAKHSFSVTFTGPAEATVAKAKDAIVKAGGTLSGDASKGDYVVATPAGKVKGNYEVQGQSITMNITDKPFIVPGSAIEAQVRKFLAA